MKSSTLKYLTLTALICFNLISVARAGLITPGIIWGEGNINQGFTTSIVDGLELGLRAKKRYPSPNDSIGVGIIQDAQGNYLFDSTGTTIPANRSIWSFDWSINSDINNGINPLTTYSYIIGVDYDPSPLTNLMTYNPLSSTSTGYYLGNNDSWINTDGDKSSAVNVADFIPAADSLLAGSLMENSNIAQNSVNMGFLPGAPLGSGQYVITLSAFSDSNDLVASTSIDVFVDTTPVNAPSTITLLAFCGSILFLRRRKIKQS